MFITRVLNWCRAVLSEPDGSPSSTRVLMYVFSFFSMHLIWRCFYHIYQLTDATQVTVWLSNMPLLITSLIGLIALPYGINKGSATMSDIANMMASAKHSEAASNNIIGELKGMFMKDVAPSLGAAPPPSAPAQPVATPPATGTNGAKG